RLLLRGPLAGGLLLAGLRRRLRGGQRLAEELRDLPGRAVREILRLDPLLPVVPGLGAGHELGEGREAAVVAQLHLSLGERALGLLDRARGALPLLLLGAHRRLRGLLGRVRLRRALGRAEMRLALALAQLLLRDQRELL